MTEEWRDVKGFEGIYQVSTKGRVRSIDRLVLCKDGRLKNLKGRILSPSHYRNGYVNHSLSKNGKRFNTLTHRLVAIAFIENAHNLPFVNHKDEVRHNNCVENLEWCTPKENSNYGNAIKKRFLNVVRNGTFAGKNNPMYGIKGKDNPKSVHLIQKTLNGKFVRDVYGYENAAKIVNGDPSAIRHAANGKTSMSAGYIWEIIK